MQVNNHCQLVAFPVIRDKPGDGEPVTYVDRVLRDGFGYRQDMLRLGPEIQRSLPFDQVERAVISPKANEHVRLLELDLFDSADDGHTLRHVEGRVRMVGV